MERPGLHKGLRWLVVITLLPVLLCGCVERPSPREAAADPLPALSPGEQALGIAKVALRLSAGGYMLDFRYRAVDPERASILFDRQTKPYLVHEATNAMFLIPAPAKIGALRQTTNKPEAGKIYFMIFANPGQYVKAGDLVTVVFGEQRIEHLVVE